MPILVLPKAAYIHSFLEGERELRQVERRSFMGTLDPLVSTNAAILKSLVDTAAGLNLPPGRTQSTAFWLIDDREEFVGSVSIRGALSNDELRILVGHIGYTIRPSLRRQGYGKLILRLALPKANAMGIDPALLTCDKTNVASRKIIESCGGVYESEAPQKPGLPPKIRFWVPTCPIRRSLPVSRSAVK